jgi:nickel/cobalt transporter (NicO) family protein
MRRGLSLLGLAVALGLAGLWASGALAALGPALAEAQRAAQERLAGAVRALRGGEAGALAALLGLCFAYGVLHAAGPGHGKALLGGYGVARRVPVLRLSALAVAGAAGQAAVAVALVYGLVAVLGLAGRQVAEGGGAWVTHGGNLMVAALGGWLFWRGVRGMGQGGRVHRHDPEHAHGPGCGHSHGPTADEAAAVGSLREAALLVGGIAARPCSGALFLLVLTWQLGIGAAGVAGAFAMGAGVAAVTVGVAALAVWSREGVLAALPGAGIARVLPAIEATLGAVLLAAALVLLAQAL